MLVGASTGWRHLVYVKTGVFTSCLVEVKKLVRINYVGPVSFDCETRLGPHPEP